MMQDESRKGRYGGWWVLGRAYTFLWRVFLLAFAGFSVFYAVDPFYGRTEDLLRFAAVAVIFCYLFGRLLIVAISVQDDFVLLRRLLPGWVERVPISRLAYGIHYQLRAPVGGVLGKSVTLLGWPMMPAIIQGTYRTASDGKDHDARADWAVLVGCLRNLFELRGRWKLVRAPFWIWPG